MRKKEARRNEDGFEGELDAMVDGVALLPRHFDEVEETIDFAFGYRTAVGPARELGEIDASTGKRVMPGRVAATKNSAVAFGKRRWAGIVRAADFDVAQLCGRGGQFDGELWIAAAEVQAELDGAQAFGSVADGEGFGGDAVDQERGLGQIARAVGGD